MKRLQFALLLAIPLCWFFFKLLPIYTQPAACSTANFIYAENLEHYKIWFFQVSNLQINAFDDSTNFLYVTALWTLIHFFKFTTIKAALTISAISIIVSIYLLQRIIDSRFWSINLLLVGLLFMSTQIWAGVLGDEILFQGMLWLLALRSFWKHRYSWLMIWTAVNIIARIDNFFILMPLILVSYWDIKELKERYKRKFILSRIRKTILFLILPIAIFYFYIYLYFVKIAPYHWLHTSTDSKSILGFFNKDAFYFLMHYLRFMILPLVIGVIFYFLKERKDLHFRYYAIAVGFIIIPSIYVCTFSQEENLAYKNYYSIYIGCMVLCLLFIRDFRSISQAIATAIFVGFFGFKTAFSFLEKTLQSDYSNMYYLANDLSSIKNGHAVVYYDNYISWMGNWNSVFASGKHTTSGKQLSVQEILNEQADIILVPQKIQTQLYHDKYDKIVLPASTRQFEKQNKPENSLELFFYKYAHKVPYNKSEKINLLVLKSSKHYNNILEITAEHAGKLE